MNNDYQGNVQVSDKKRLDHEQHVSICRQPRLQLPFAFAAIKIFFPIWLLPGNTYLPLATKMALDFDDTTGG
jgi:hypothetical protein